MAVEQVVGTSGLERDRQRFGLDGAIDHSGSLQIFGEEVVPGAHLLGVDEQDGAGDIAGFGKVLGGALPDVRRRERD